MSHSKQPAAESFALALMVLAFAACNSGNDSSDEKVSTKQFPIDSAVSASIKSKGVPGDIADFLAASKLDTSRIDAHTVKAVRTYPNGATREITFRLTPGIKYTPTAAESARVAGGGAAIYDVKYSLDTSNGAYVLKLDYFVPDSGLRAPGRTREAGRDGFRNPRFRRPLGRGGPSWRRGQHQLHPGIRGRAPSARRPRRLGRI